LDHVAKLNERNVPKEVEEVEIHTDENTSKPNDDQTIELVVTDEKANSDSKVDKKHATPAHGKKHEEHVDEEEMIWEIKTVLLKQDNSEDLPTSTKEDHVPQIPDSVAKWNYDEIISEFSPRDDVIVLTPSCNDDETNFDLAGYFMKRSFKRVVCVIRDPMFADPVSSTGALPVFLFSGSEWLLYQCVTNPRPDIASTQFLLKMIKPEAANFPENVSLLPSDHVVTSEDRDKSRSFLANSINMVALDTVDEPTTEPNKTSPEEPQAKGPLAFLKKGLDPLKNFSQSVNSSIQTSFQEMKDPIGSIQKRIDNMPVVDDDQREEYLDSLADLHSVKPLSTFSIFNNEQQPNAPITADRQNIEKTFRSSYSVFEEYNNSNTNNPFEDEEKK